MYPATPEQVTKLEKKGWTIVCESPFELEYVSPDAPQDGVIGKASGIAAKDLWENLVKQLIKKEKKALKVKDSQPKV